MHPRSALALVLTAAALSGPSGLSDLSAQSSPVWRDLSTPGPSPRYGHAMTWDSHRDLGVLFGGYEFDADRHFADTWTYDGERWTRVQDGPAIPQPRRDHAMCFDARRGVVVLFGGMISNAFQTDTRYLGDTWEFDGTTWRQVQVAGPTPTARVTDIAYDAGRGVVVLVGGTGAQNSHRDVWEYDGARWTERGRALLPRLRPGYELAFDAMRGVTVVQPRYQLGQTGPWQTFEWDGTALTVASSTTAGPNFPDGDMDYDARRRRVVAVGTWFTGPVETWEYDGTDWQLNSATTGQRALHGHSLVGADALGSLVLFGGEKERGPWLVATDELFELAEFAAVRSTGTPCSPSGHFASLQPLGNSLPRAGGRFDVEVTGLQPDHAALLLIGLQADQWSGQPLPFDLAPIGLPGCLLRTSAELVTVMAAAQPTELQLPATPELHGQDLHLQALVVDGGTTPVGVTNALTARLGR